MNEIEKYIEGDARPLFDSCMSYRHFFLLWAYKHYHLSGVQASDLFSDTLILLCKRISDGKISRTTCCILTILINLGSGLAVDAIRKHETENEHQEPFAYETPCTSDDAAGAQLVLHEIQNCYVRYLAILSDLDQNILIDKFIYGLSAKAIKEKYNLSSNEDVRQRICRAKKAIIEKFGQEWSNL
jgi:RNA polymerase sigma factor (sigma-70 family)